MICVVKGCRNGMICVVKGCKNGMICVVKGYRNGIIWVVKGEGLYMGYFAKGYKNIMIRDIEMT